MKRLHIVGRKNHGKTTLIVELVQEFVRRGVSVGTIKHSHHRHELDVPGKDSHRHREAGANIVGILTPPMTAMFRPVEREERAFEDRYKTFGRVFDACQFVLVEGDSRTEAPKIEVWRAATGGTPLAWHDPSILAVVTDDPCPSTVLALPRKSISALADWISQRFSGPPTDTGG